MMQQLMFLFTVMALNLFTEYNSVTGHLHDQLSNFEVLQISPVNLHRSKRDVNDLRENTLEYDFKALGKKFHIFLQQRSRIETLLPGFEVYSVDGEGHEEKVDVDISSFYEGALVDERGSWVQANVEGRMIHAWIESRNETYVIEPASPFLKNATNEQVIIYKGSNLKQPKKNFCGFVRANYSNSNVSDSDVQFRRVPKFDTKEKSSHRTKRAVSDSSNLDTCGVLLVADYRFYKKIGQNSVATSSRILIELLDRVNRIYRPTVFKDSTGRALRGYGFGIKRILVHTKWYTGKEKDHYNKETATSWNDRELLSAFDREDYSDYCLAHLFTYQRFNAGTLGLAYIASDRMNAPGGICSSTQYCGRRSNERFYCSINTGWTTFQDSSGNTLVTLESHLVTSHELGHNFGSSHDPDTPECSPPPEKGGKYLMYQYSVSGYEPNNHKFSPCSRRAIGRVLDQKASKCFQKRQKSFCGNSRQEGNEECDAGTLGLQGKDSCCSSACKLRAGMKCSPINHACCTSQCKVAPSGKLCAHKDATSPCEGNAFCDGKSFACPTPKPLDDVKCGIEGKCRNRTCIPYCELKGMIPCQCDEIENACLMCCRKTLNDSCTTIKPSFKLKNGVPCIQGMCNDGKCMKRISISIERFWHIIKYVDVSEIGKIMWKNIVGTVIILSLIIWIPASCFISYYDRQTEKGNI